MSVLKFFLSLLLVGVLLVVLYVAGAWLRLYGHHEGPGQVTRVVIPKPVLSERADLQRFDAGAITALAKISGLTGRHLIRLFQKYFNYTPSHYLWKIRLEKSAQLLCRSGLTIGEVAFQCGFQSQAHFSRAIKKHYGYSPSELRKRNWYQDLEILRQDIKHEIY